MNKFKKFKDLNKKDKIKIILLILLLIITIMFSILFAIIVGLVIFFKFNTGYIKSLMEKFVDKQSVSMNIHNIEDIIFYKHYQI